MKKAKLDQAVVEYVWKAAYVLDPRELAPPRVSPSACLSGREATTAR